MPLFYTVAQPFRWAARDYVPGDVIELSRRNLARHPTLAGKVVLLGESSPRPKAPQKGKRKLT